MAKEKFAKTQAIRVLEEQGVSFFLHSYRYVDRGGTEAAAKALHVDEHLVVKTLIMETDQGEPLILLMHGDRKASAKALARQLGIKKVRPCDPATAHRHTGYLVGGISPFGTRKKMKVLMEATIGGLPRIYINAGRRGLMAEMNPEDLVKILDPLPVHVAV